MVLRLVRAFITGGFVQRQIQFVPVCPVSIFQRKYQTGRFKRGVRVGAWFAMNRNPMIQYQGTAVFSATEPLALQYFFQRHVHLDSVQEFALPGLKNGVVPFAGVICKKKPRVKRGFSGLIQ